MALKQNNSYLNGMLSDEEVIKELIKELLDLAKQIKGAHEERSARGLTPDELAFYDALTRPQAIKDFYENAELIATTRELTKSLRSNKTVDWQKKRICP